jgi:metallo-beta-lactamase class B
MKCALLFLLLVSTAALRAQGDPSWRQPSEPVRIIGNIYYVGTRGLSSFLIVTPGGGILIDSGEAESVPFVRANVEKLGFRMADIRILLAGHAHFDHVGGHADVKQLTGAQVMVMDADREALESGVDRSALDGKGWKPVKVDRVLKDGDTVALGGATLTAHLTPGHTQGCTTWTTEAMQDGRRVQVAFVCSVTINEGVQLVGNSRVPGIAQQYAEAFRVLQTLKPDVFVAEHPGVFGLEVKGRRAASHAQPDPFIDAEGYQRLIETSERAYLKQLEHERKR